MIQDIDRTDRKYGVLPIDRHQGGVRPQDDIGMGVLLVSEIWNAELKHYVHQGGSYFRIGLLCTLVKDPRGVGWARRHFQLWDRPLVTINPAVRRHPTRSLFYPEALRFEKLSVLKRGMTFTGVP